MLHVNHTGYQARQRVILQDIAFTALPGEVIAVLGPNGAGKSTLIRMLSRELASSQGDILWKNRTLPAYTALEMARERAVLSQQTRVSIDFTADEVVMMGRYPHFEHRPHTCDYQAVAECMRITETDSFHGRPFRMLSGGEQQRVHMARTLAQVNGTGKGKLLLLDEPLNNLDIRFQHHFLQLTRDFTSEGNIAITILHDINLASQYADKILLIKSGKQVAFGTPAEVLREDLLEESYGVPAKVLADPYTQCPHVFFGAPGRLAPAAFTTANDQYPTEYDSKRTNPQTALE